MKVVISLEHVYLRTPNGRIWTQTMFAGEFFRRYMSVFDSVVVVARVRDVPSIPDGWKPGEVPGVSFAPLPFYHGPLGYLRCRSRLRQAACAAIDPHAALILRVASPIAGLMAHEIARQKHPFACEVVCDPWDVFAPGGVPHPLRPFFRWHFTRQLRKQCLEACGVAYVTEHMLQKRYPTAREAPSFGVSDVELSHSAFVQKNRNGELRNNGPFRILMVGSMAQLYKAPDVLVRAIARCAKNEVNLVCHFVGDGQYRPQIERLASELGVSDRCKFLGQLPSGDAVRQELDRADLFVLPSRAEGLPRALVEAMARGAPCVASSVCGIPELLPQDCLVQPGDDLGLSLAIAARAKDAERRARESARNLERAQAFADHRLDAKRTEFYRLVHDATARWLETRR